MIPRRGDWVSLYTAAGYHVGVGQISAVTVNRDELLAAVSIRLSDGPGPPVPKVYVPADCTVVAHA